MPEKVGAHNRDSTLRLWAITTLRAFTPDAAYRHTPKTERPAIASTYVAPTADKTLRTDRMMHAAPERSGTQPIVLDAGHCPHVSRSDAVADVLTDNQMSHQWPINMVTIHSPVWNHN